MCRDGKCHKLLGQAPSDKDKADVVESLDHSPESRLLVTMNAPATLCPRPEVNHLHVTGATASLPRSERIEDQLNRLVGAVL
jgi:hypothetical protein